MEDQIHIEDTSVQQSVDQQTSSQEQQQENKTGIPNRDKAALEVLWGISLNEIRVYENSPLAAQEGGAGVVAYVRGSEIHLAPEANKKQLDHALAILCRALKKGELPRDIPIYEGETEGSATEQDSEESATSPSEEKKQNKTGIPDKLKTWMENKSGYKLDEVRVHYDSPKPAEMGALAYAQGLDVYIGPGQDKHLAHELWHVIQQMEGRVQATVQMKGGEDKNDNKGLEKEANRAQDAALKDSQNQEQNQELQTMNPSSEVVQMVELPHRVADAQLDAYKASLVGLVETNAARALELDNIASDGGGYLDRWLDLATMYLGDNTTVPNFIHAAYGYAVETLTNMQLGSINGDLPAGWAVQSQVTQGMTRPDIVVFNAAAKQVAWLDITSDGSPGHIFSKAGGGWKTKDYVSEILYPALNLGSITSEGGIGARVRAKNVYQRTQEQERVAQVQLAADIENIYELHDVSAPPKTKASFDGYFDDFSFSHDMIRSLIEMAGADLGTFGYKRANANGRNKAAAMEFIYAQYIG